MAITVNELISSLEKIKSEGKGDVRVIFDKNGCWDGPREISEVQKTGYIFREEDGGSSELYWLDDVDLQPNDKVTDVVVLYSDREEWEPL